MELYGWKYEGRKISELLQEQMLHIIECINDPSFVASRSWPELQSVIAEQMGIQPGQIRTIKRVMEEFNILKKGVLNSKCVPDYTVFTENGMTLIELFQTEKLMKKHPTKENLNTLKDIKEIYKLYYQKVLNEYCYNNEGVILHPLKATLKTMRKHRFLDYWEWYLLNTIIQEDNNQEQEKELDECIDKYRKGLLNFNKNDVKENQLSHSYILGNFEFANLIEIEGSKYSLKATINEEEREIVDSIINEG